MTLLFASVKDASKDKAISQDQSQNSLYHNTLLSFLPKTQAPQDVWKNSHHGILVSEKGWEYYSAYFFTLIFPFHFVNMEFGGKEWKKMELMPHLMSLEFYASEKTTKLKQSGHHCQCPTPAERIRTLNKPERKWPFLSIPIWTFIFSGWNWIIMRFFLFSL